MATKNLQMLAVQNAVVTSVRVTGMNCGSMQADGKFQAPFLALHWHPLAGPFAIRTGPDSSLAEDSARAAEAVLRTGRSTTRGVVPAY